MPLFPCPVTLPPFLFFFHFFIFSINILFLFSNFYVFFSFISFHFGYDMSIFLFSMQAGETENFGDDYDNNRPVEPSRITPTGETVRM